MTFSHKVDPLKKDGLEKTLMPMDTFCFSLQKDLSAKTCFLLLLMLLLLQSKVRTIQHDYSFGSIGNQFLGRVFPKSDQVV